MNTKIYITAAAAVALIVAGILAGHLWSNYNMRRLEQAVETAKTEAAAKQDAANKAEQAAAEYKQKIDYLEANLGELRAIANKQDEELQKITTNTADARRDVERARKLRSVVVTNDELCRRLAEVGHPCDE